MKAVTGDVRKDTFTAHSNDNPQLLMLGAPWCVYCKPLRPQVAKVSLDNPDLDVYYVDIDSDPDMATDLGVMSIPKLYLVADGEWTELSGRTTGEIQKEIDQLL